MSRSLIFCAAAHYFWTLPKVRVPGVSFTDFTLGWTELHRFMGVNEQPAELPSMTFDAGGEQLDRETKEEQNEGRHELRFLVYIVVKVRLLRAA
jgi:hypothetical protein